MGEARTYGRNRKVSSSSGGASFLPNLHLRVTGSGNTRPHRFTFPLVPEKTLIKAQVLLRSRVEANCSWLNSGAGDSQWPIIRWLFTTMNRLAENEQKRVPRDNRFAN